MYHFIFSFLVFLLSASASVAEQVGHYQDSVFLVFPEGSDEPTGVATLVHKSGFFVTTLHATNWDLDRKYHLRQPSMEDSRPIGSHYVTVRVSENDINRNGYISVLQATEWDKLFAPSRIPKLCLRPTQTTSFSGSYVMFTQSEWLHSEKEFKNIDGRFNVKLGVMQTESGSLVLEKGEFGIGIIEAHLDNDVRIDDLDDLRSALQGAEWARVMAFAENENVNLLYSIPEAEDSNRLRQALAPDASEDYRGSEFFIRLTESRVENAIDAYRVVNSLLQPQTYCGFVNTGSRIKSWEFYLGVADFARNSCAESIAPIISSHHENVIRTGLRVYCAQYDSSSSSSDFSTSVEGGADHSGLENTQAEYYDQVLASANALANDVLIAASSEVFAPTPDTKIQNSLNGAYQILTQTLNDIGTDSIAKRSPETLSDSYLISAKLALGSGDEAISSTAEELLIASNELSPSSETNLLLAARRLEASDFKAAREYLAVAGALDLDSRFNGEIASLGKQLGIVSPEGKTITIAAVNNGHMINMRKVAEAYTEETGVNLEWVSLEEGVLREQVTSDTATGGGRYDIISIGMQEAPIWGAAGWIEPLNFGVRYDIDDIIPSIRAGLSHEGTMYAAPFYGESSMVMYRKDLMDAAGVSIADNDSWDNIKAAAAAVHDPDNGVYGACLRGKPGWGDNMAFLATMVNSFGGAWFDAELQPTINTPEWNAAINFYVDLLGNYGPPGSEGNSFNEILALYNDGKCGLWIDATVAASFIEVDDVAYAQSPNAGNPVGASWLWAWAMAVPAGSENAEEAKAFIEWATSKEYIQAVGNHPEFGWDKIPTGQRASTYGIPEFQAAAGFAAAELAAIDSAAPEATNLKPYVGVQFAAIPEFPEIGSVVAQEMAAALSGAKSVDEALAAAQQAADTIMREAGYY